MSTAAPLFTSPRTFSTRTTQRDPISSEQGRGHSYAPSGISTLSKNNSAVGLPLICSGSGVPSRLVTRTASQKAWSLECDTSPKRAQLA